jgi:mRNA interferase RelE/StbE
MESSYKVKITIEGWKRIKKLDNSVSKKILEKSKILCDFKNINNIKALKGELKNGFRYRMGDMRVIFEVDEVEKIVWIVDVGFRGSVYD